MDLEEFLGGPKVSEERQQYLEGFYPLVRFVIPGEQEKREYHHLIRELIADFVAWCDPKNERQSEVFRITCADRWNEESGIGTFYVDGQYICHCKMYLFDGGGRKRFFIK